MKRCLPLLPALLILTGCFGWNEPSQLVPESPFGKAPPAPPVQRAAHQPADLETAARVDRVGRQLLVANPQIGIKPLFVTIGAPQVEMFHRGTAELTVTEGLVRQCASDGQLAAVLAVELGKMVAEREALAAPTTRRPDRRPPPELLASEPGSAGTPDLTNQAVLARYDPPRRRDASPPPLPDPRQLAKTYLTGAGFPAAELDQAAPVLRAAQSSATFQRQLAQPGPARPWTK